MKPSSEVERAYARVSGFRQRQPKDGEPASQRTDVYVGYDDTSLYAVFVCFDNDPHGIRAHMNPRGNTGDDDWVHVVLDTFHDRRRAYMFGASPLGVQWDALWTEGQGADTAFDTLFYTRGALTDEGYVLSMEIPFKSLRFLSQTDQTWGILFGRSIPRLNEQSFWPQYSSRVEGRLNQEGILEGLSHISPGRNIQLLPYAGFRSFRALDRLDPLRPKYVRDRAAGDGGLDAKIVLRDRLVTDIAINPDFSQVESDEPQVTTNQRFEVFFPEKRPFFLENANYFQTPINLVFTRRIADPEFGSRVTGKVGKFAIGALVADDQAPGRTLQGDPTFGKRAGFGIVRINRDILRQSSVGVIFADRSFNAGFNRTAGLDGRFKLNRNWTTQFQGVATETRFSNGGHRAGPAYEAGIKRTSRQFNFDLTYSDRSAGFLTLTGFSPRQDYRGFNSNLSYSFRPEGKRFIAATPGLGLVHLMTRDGKRLQTTYTAGLMLEAVGQTFMEVWYHPEQLGLRPSEAAVSAYRRFDRQYLYTNFRTSPRPQLQFSFSLQRGEDINYRPAAGREASLADWTATDASFTVRPVTQMSVTNRYLFTRLADRKTGAAIFNDHIFRSRWNWQFTRELSVRFILQYNADLVNPGYTTLEPRKNVNADFLVAYQANAWTAFYVGYNSNAQNIELVPTASGAQISRLPHGFTNDGRQFFAKLSYLIRF